MIWWMGGLVGGCLNVGVINSGKKWFLTFMPVILPLFSPIIHSNILSSSHHLFSHHSFYLTD